MKAPTTTELATLAAQLGGNPKHSIRKAMDLWRAAEQELGQMADRAEYLREIVANIYTDSPKEWKARIDDFPGDRADVDRALAAKVSTEQVKRQLFKDKNLTRAQRDGLFTLLVDYARAHGMTQPPNRTRSGWPRLNLVPETEGEWAERTNQNERERVERELQSVRESMKDETVSWLTVRWAVHARQKQLAASKSRVVPQSLKQRRR